MNCGQRATERLQRFQNGSTVAAPGATDNVLDLKQPAAPQTAGQPPAPTRSNPPTKSLHGMHARTLHTQGAARQTSTIDTPPEAQPAESTTTAAETMTSNQLADDATMAARAELNRQVEAAAYTAAPTETDTTYRTQPQYAQSNTPQGATEVTHMEPHQVYPLKTDSATQQPDTSESPAENSYQLEDYELPPVETMPPQNTGMQQKQSWFRRLSPVNLMDHAAIRVGTAGLCILLLAGYVTYLNYPDIAVRVAASRANVNASIPEYIPDDYDFNGPIVYGNGQLTINFRDQDQTISLSQSQTQWDSQSLLTNYINRRTSDYETYQQNGLTIYTYDNRHAAWVNGGTMYTIDSETYLSQQEIVNMASSL